MGRESRSPPGNISVYMLERVIPGQVTAGVKVMRLATPSGGQRGREGPEQAGGTSTVRSWGCF